jgi:hypothetical protein
MIIIDYGPGLHGNFLEYIINRYIFKIPVAVDQIFHPTGAAHFLKVDKNYQACAIVKANHYAGSDVLKNVTQAIYIKHYSPYDFVLLTNIFNRCHPRNEQILNEDVIHQEQLKIMGIFENETQRLRNHWYVKLKEKHCSQFYTKQLGEIPSHDFDYQSFFTLDQFVEELKKTANFLSMTLHYDTTLSELWNLFIKKNTGWSRYQTARKIVCAILNQENITLPTDDWQLQAYINYNLSSMFDIYDGALFDYDSYPNNTLEIYHLIQQHLSEFDSKFA